jgi:hypothetical protein
LGCAKSNQVPKRRENGRTLQELSSREKSARSVSHPLLALISFIVSFLIARTFTFLRTGVILKAAGYHIHHYWYGIALLAIGGWLGISYDDDRIVTLAAVLYGAGGGLIGDEAGLLLSGNYWTGITYTFIVILVAFVLVTILFRTYSKAISREIEGFTRSRLSLYSGIILAAVSINFLISRNLVVERISIAAAAIGGVIMIAYVVQRIRNRAKQKSETRTAELKIDETAK